MSGDSPDFQPHKKKEEETDLLMPERTKAPIASIATAGTALSASEMPSDSTATENAEEKQEFIRHDKKEDSKVSVSVSYQKLYFDSFRKAPSPLYIISTIKYYCLTIHPAKLT